MKIRILIPTFNENSNIDPFLRRVFEVLAQVKAAAEILVIDDSSPDGTAATVRGLLPEFANLKLLVRPEREGLGKAYLAGIAESLDSADALITMDADFSHDPAHLPALVEAGRSHSLVVGSRYIAGGGVEDWEPWRRALSGAGNAYSRMVTGMPIHDLTSGFQLVHTDALRRLGLSETLAEAAESGSAGQGRVPAKLSSSGLAASGIAASGYAFQIELKYRLWRSGASWAEVPITFRARRGGESKLTGHIVTEGVLTPWRLRMGG